MRTSALVQSVIDRLRTAVGGVDVREFPDNIRTFTLTHPVGALLVRYTGSEYDSLKISQIVAQKRKPLIEVVIVARSLLAGAGAYDILDDTKNALRGFAPEGKDRMRLVTDGFLSEMHGIWAYSAVFTFNTVESE